MNRTRPYGDHEYSNEAADTEFRENGDYVKRAVDEACPKCDDETFAHWESDIAGTSDYDYCGECGYGRAYLPSEWFSS